jgi:hypothetical protein
MKQQDDNAEIRTDFLQWCEDYRLLGRDRLWPAYRAGWIAGYATAVDQVANQHQEHQDHAD